MGGSIKAIIDTEPAFKTTRRKNGTWSGGVKRQTLCTPVSCKRLPRQGVAAYSAGHADVLLGSSNAREYRYTMA